MTVVAYIFAEPAIEETPDPHIWGWEIDRVYRDLGQRSVRDLLLQDCQQKTIEYLLVRRLEELGDSVAEVKNILTQLQALKVKLITTETDFQTQLNIFELIEQLQADRVSRRLRQGHARNRLQALPPPGKAPYGYRRGQDRYIIDRATAPVVKEFFERFLIYGSIRGAVRFLEQKYGKKISASTGQRWLTHPIYRGDTLYHNGEVISDTHAAILSRDEAAQIDRLLRRNRRLPPRTASAPRSLAGLVSCQHCYETLTVTNVSAPRRQEKYLYLRASKCPHQPKCKSIAYDRVLTAAIERICVELPTAVRQLQMPNPDIFKEQILTEITAKENTIAQLPDLIKTGVLDRETVELRIYKLKTEISQLRNKLAALPPINLTSIATTVSIPQFWLDLSESERRFYLREFIRAIAIDPQAENLNLQLKFIFGSAEN
jgi:DNA invertase Pin-like site-specific DNA recombinase